MNELTIFDFLQKYASKDPHRIAIADLHKTYTYEQLWTLVRRLRSKYLAHGIRPAERIIVQMPNETDWIIVFLALLSIRCQVIPVAMDLTEMELASIMRKTEATCIIKRTILDDSVFRRRNSSRDMNASWPTSKDDALLHMTSGSTGTPKICIRTHGQLLAEGISYCDTLKITPDDHIANPLPLNHSYPLGFACFGGLVAGAKVSILPKMMPRSLLRYLAKHRVTIVPLVPTLVRNLVYTNISEQIDLSSVRYCMVGAGSVTKQIADDFEKKYGIPLSANYGSTETGALFARLGSSPIESVGQAMKGVEVMIRSEDGRELPAGMVGQVWVRAPSIMRAYLGNEHQPFDEQGFFPMGDLGQLDERGYLRLVGRIKSVISIGGRKVVPQEVETVLLEMPGVHDASVYGVLRPNGEWLLKAMIVRKTLITIEQVREYCAGRLSAYKIPTIIEFVDKIPRNEIGKLERNKIKS